MIYATVNSQILKDAENNIFTSIENDIPLRTFPFYWKLDRMFITEIRFSIIYLYFIAVKCLDCVLETKFSKCF